MQASQFIDLLEKHGLLAPDIIEELRKQVAASRVRMTPESIAKLLVDNGQLTRFQATKLISENTKSEAPPPVTKATVVDEDLDIQVDEEVVETVDVVETSNVAVILDDEDEPVDVEEVYVDVVEVEEAPVEQKRKSKRSTESVMDSAAPMRPVVVKPVANVNPWDSFRIYGAAAILLLLMIPLVVLGVWFLRGNADEAMKKADQLYSTTDYVEAAKQYLRFAEKFSSDDRVSYAKVRAGLAKLRNEAEKVSDPMRAFATAKETLPELEKEKALSGERNDLAGVMFAIGEKFVKKADSAKTNEEKKTLIKNLEEFLVLCQNPMYIDSTSRKNSEKRIDDINEGHDKVVRDIERTDDLDAAVTKIKKALEVEDVSLSYSIRRELLRKHIQLESDPQLKELLLQGTTTQVKLVGNTKDAFKPIEVVKNETKMRTAVLANQKMGEAGGAVPGEGVIISRVKSQVVAQSASDGKPKWRAYIGTELEGELKPVSNDPQSDVVLALPEPGILQRLKAENGESVWKVGIGKRILEPVIEANDLFVTTADGGVYCLDVNTGATRWSRQLPQTCDTGVGYVPRKNVVYAMGNHSNLYVFGRSDGICKEVFYAGHQPGAVKVPPVSLQGHLFVFDNSGAGTSNILILRYEEDGTKLRQAQLPIPLSKGHVVVSPQALGRRMAIVTDLGEIAVLDIEASKEKDQVSRTMKQVGTEVQPKRIWPLMGPTDLWLAGSSLTRYEMLISKEKLNPLWVKDKQDVFTSAPRMLGKCVLQLRTLRGTKGVRVSAVDEAGNPSWEVDLGVPVSYIHPVEGFPIKAITSQGALYSVEKEALLGSGFSTSVENVGRNERSLYFRNPIRLADGKVVLANESQGAQLIVFDPKGAKDNQSRRVVLALGEAELDAAPIAIKNFLALPLSNGQILVVDPTTGQRKMAPFQLPLQPDTKPKWIGPTLLSDQQSIAIANDSQKLFRIAVGSDMRVLLEKSIDRGLRGRLLTLGETILGIGKGNATESIEFFAAGGLDQIASLPLQGPVVWGPFLVGNTAIVQSPADGLVAVDASGAKQWTRPLPNVMLVGEPALVDGKIYISQTSGKVLQFDANSGELLGQANIGEPISGGPVIAKTTVLVPGDEGAIFAVSMSDFRSGDTQ